MNMLFLAALLATGPANGPVAHATDIKADFDDKLTDRFADALRKALPKARHMRAEGGDDAPDIYLTFLFPVTENGKRFDYAIDVMKAEPDLPPDRLASLTGTCREAEIDACAANLIAKADKSVGRD